MGLRLPIGFITRPANGAGPGGIPWIDKNHRNTLHKGFVCDKTSQLIERPFSESFPLALSNSYPLPDSLEVFKGKGSMGAFCLGNNAFGNNVVCIALESFFTARKFLEMPLGRLRSCLLERLFQSRDLLSDRIDSLSRKRFSVGVCRERDNSQIDPQKSLGIDGGSVRNIDHDVQEELPFEEDQIRLTAHLVPVKGSVMAKNKGNLDSSLEGGKRCSGQVPERKRPFVIFHSGIFLEKMPVFPVRLVTVGDLGNRPDNGLGRQDLKRFPHLDIEKVMEVVGIEHFRLEGFFGNPVAHLVELFHRLKKSLGLFIRWCQFGFQCDFHGNDFSVILN